MPMRRKWKETFWYDMPIVLKYHLWHLDILLLMAKNTRLVAAVAFLKFDGFWTGSICISRTPSLRAYLSRRVNCLIFA